MIMSPGNDIIFSILTPTWNRGAYLTRVFEGLKSQTLTNFEWIVADDGSNDNTIAVVNAFAKNSNFPVILIQADRHVGKVRVDNESIRQARGKFIVWCDSDDCFRPSALQRIWETWLSIPLGEREQFVGITALAETTAGIIINPFPGVKFKDVSWNDIAELYKVSVDMLYCARSDALKASPFPEVDMVIPESVVWTAIGNSLTRLIPEALIVKEYKADHAISFSGTMSYNRGRAYSLAITTQNLSKYRIPFSIKFWRLITFIRYSVHGEIAIRTALKLWAKNSSYLSFVCALPFGLFLVIKDRLQGKVRYTHREFLLAQHPAKISAKLLN